MPCARSPTGMHACMDAGGRAASGTSGRGGRAASGTSGRGGRAASGTSGRDKPGWIYSELPQEGSAIRWIATSPSFRRKPESSGLDSPCPLRGNDTRHVLAGRLQAVETAKLSGIPTPPLDSGCRRNDAGPRSHAYARVWRAGHFEAIRASPGNGLLSACLPRSQPACARPAKAGGDGCIMCLRRISFNKFLRFVFMPAAFYSWI